MQDVIRILEGVNLIGAYLKSDAGDSMASLNSGIQHIN